MHRIQVVNQIGRGFGPRFPALAEDTKGLLLVNLPFLDAEIISYKGNALDRHHKLYTIARDFSLFGSSCSGKHRRLVESVEHHQINNRTLSSGINSRRYDGGWSFHCLTGARLLLICGHHWLATNSSLFLFTSFLFQDSSPENLAFFLMHGYHGS